MCTDVTHTGAETAHHLIDGFGNRSTVRHTTFNTFRNKLFIVGLEITVLGTALHGTDGSHSAINLELSSLIDLHVTGSLFAAGKQRTHHNDMCTGSDCFHDIAGILDTAVSDNGNIILGSSFRTVEDRGDLRNTDTGNHACRADGTGSDTDFYAVNTAFNQCAGRFRSSNVAGDQLNIGIFVLDLLNGIHDILGMAVSTVQNKGIDTDIDQCAGTIQDILRDTESCCAQKTPGRIFC